MVACAQRHRDVQHYQRNLNNWTPTALNKSDNKQNLTLTCIKHKIYEIRALVLYELIGRVRFSIYAIHVCGLYLLRSHYSSVCGYPCCSASTYSYLPYLLQLFVALYHFALKVKQIIKQLYKRMSV